MNDNQNQMEMSIFGVGPTGMKVYKVYHEKIKKMNFDREHFQPSRESIFFINILL
jgi:hypothetical protein